MFSVNTKAPRRAVKQSVVWPTKQKLYSFEKAYFQDVSYFRRFVAMIDSQRILLGFFMISMLTIIDGRDHPETEFKNGTNRWVIYLLV